MKVVKGFKIRQSGEFMLILIFAGIFLLMGMLSPDKFLSANNFRTMAFQLPEFGLMALAMMVVVLTGGINLSITTGAALSSIVAAFILSSDFAQEHAVAGVLAALAACMLVSVMTGVLNGTLVAYVGVAPMLVTLGSKMLFEGLGLNMTKGGSISGFPEIYSYIGNEMVLGLPVPLIIFAAAVAASYFLLERSAWGTEIYMVGCNETATKFSGIDTRKTLMKVYIYSGLMAGLASVLISSRYNSAKTDYGSSYMMQSVTAVVLGGTSISGGHGTVAGTVIAVCIIQVVSTGLNILQVNRYMIDIIIGLILITVLAVRYLSKVMEDRKKIRARSAA